MADKALVWLRQHQSFAPDKPFFMYWAPGAAHGPHHIFKEWADKYKGKFDNGWDAYRERVFTRQKEIGWIPPDTKLTPRADTMASWDSIPESQRPFQRRLMEVFAGFLEHVDAQVGRLVDGLDELGLRDNTIIFYVFGDNGSSAEGQNGTISELLAQNMIPNTIEQQLAALDKIGGLDALGTAKTDNMYHAGWAWAGDTPFRYTKLVASHFGGTRNPLVDLLAEGDQARTRRRGRSSTTSTTSRRRSTTSSASSRPTSSTDGSRCRSTASAWPMRSPTPTRPGRKLTQYFENNGSRAIYHDGWIAGDLRPADPLAAGHARARHMGRQQGPLGALRPPATTSPRPTISPTKEPAASRGDEEAVPDRGQGQQGLSGRRRPVDAPASGGPRQGSLYALGLRLRRRPGCRSSPVPGLGRESNRVVVDCRRRRERVGRASTRSAASAAG